MLTKRRQERKENNETFSSLPKCCIRYFEGLKNTHVIKISIKTNKNIKIF